MAERYEDKKPPMAPASDIVNDPTGRSNKGFPAWVYALPVLLILLIGGAIYSASKNRTSDTTPVAGTQNTSLQSNGSGGVTTPQSKSFDTQNTNATNPAANTTADSTATPTDPNAVASTPTGGPGSQATPTNALNDPSKAVDDKEITDLMAFGAATDRAPFAGRNAKLTDVTVRKTVTGRGFYVGTSDQDQMLVFLDTSVDKKGLDKATTVTEGQKVSVTGTLEPVPTQEVLSQQYAFTGKDYDDLKKQSVYLHAMRIQFK